MGNLAFGVSRVALGSFMAVAMPVLAKAQDAPPALSTQSTKVTRTAANKTKRRQPPISGSAVRSLPTPQASTPTPTPTPTLVTPTIETPADALRHGTLYGYARIIDFKSINAFFGGFDQNTASYGGVIGYKTAPYLGFTLAIDGGFQRGIDHSSNPNYIDSFLGPDVTVLGQAYVDWSHGKFDITAGNQKVNVPFISDYDYRMIPLLFQGLTARYGDNDDYVTAFAIDRYKSYIDSSFTRETDYNSRIDPFSPAGVQQTPGFWGVGGVRKLDFDPVVVTAQAWYTKYSDYANLGYVEGQIIKKDGPLKPFLGVQILGEDGDGTEILGRVDAQMYGAQLGIKYNSITATLNYDRITPHASAYGDGSVVLPYSHFVASGPIFAQPFFQSTQDLGSGNVYSIDASGSPFSKPFVILGARYSFADQRAVANTHSIDLAEWLAYGIVDLSAYVPGLSIVDFVGVEREYGNTPFFQNRVAVEYKWKFSS